MYIPPTAKQPFLLFFFSLFFPTSLNHFFSGHLTPSDPLPYPSHIRPRRQSSFSRRSFVHSSFAPLLHSSRPRHLRRARGADNETRNEQIRLTHWRWICESESYGDYLPTNEGTHVLCSHVSRHYTRALRLSLSLPLHSHDKIFSLSFHLAYSLPLTPLRPTVIMEKKIVLRGADNTFNLIKDIYRM